MKDEFRDIWMVGSSIRELLNLHVVTFAKARIARLEKVLGREDVDKAIAETQAEFAKTVSPEHWEIFLHGNEAQWAAVQDQIQREIDKGSQAYGLNQFDSHMTNTSEQRGPPKPADALGFAGS